MTKQNEFFKKLKIFNETNVSLLYLQHLQSNKSSYYNMYNIYYVLLKTICIYKTTCIIALKMLQVLLKHFSCGQD